jgi:N-acylneuraminate cytidylyltransferase
MMSYILEAARKSQLFDVVHVSTESHHVAEVAGQYGCPVDFARPIELADDLTPIMPVLRYVLDEYAKLGRRFDEVAMLMACAPLVTATDLVQAHELFCAHGAAIPVLAVAPYPCPVEWAFRRDSKGRLSPIQPGMFAVRSQDLEPSYFDAGLFSFFPAKAVLNTEGAGSDANFIGQILPRYKAIDIDTPDDWTLAEAIFRGVRQSAGG